MIKILRNKDFNITDFLVDNVEDVNELKNTNGCAAGSTAYIVTTGETYIKKNNGDWVERVEVVNNENTNSGGATGDVWLDGNEIHINVKKYRDVSEYFNSNFTFPFDVNVEDGDSYNSLGSITVTEETDIIVIDLTPYIDYEKLWMGSSHGMFNLRLEKIGEEYIVSNMGFTLSGGNG